MTVGRLAFCFAVSIGCACAQSVDGLEIRGVVIETGLNFGVAGAQVTLFAFGAEPSRASERTAIAGASTDSNGAFQFHPPRLGTYYVEVKKEGYFARSSSGPSVAPAESTGDALALDRDHRSQDLRFSLMRLGEIRGRVIDEDGKPLGGVGLQVHAVSRDWLTFAGAVTEKDGSFVAPKLMPGDYLVRVLPQHVGHPETVQPFSGSDAEAVDRDLESSEWPGGSEERNAIPLHLASGAALSVGTITARAVPYYRARVSVRSADCGSGESWDFAAIPAGAPFGMGFPLKASCGREFLVRYLRPGSYWFSVSNGEKDDRYEWALASVDVKRENFEVALTMSPGVEIRGQVIAAEEGMPMPSGKIGIGLRPMVGTHFAEQATPDSTGRFVFKNLDGARRTVSVGGLSSKYYVKEIRYGGVTVPDGNFTPAPGGILEIVIDDKPATLKGTAAGAAVVIAVKWPIEAGQDASFPLFSAGVSGERQGRFQIDGLAPGEYRVLALPPGGTGRSNLEDFLRLQRNAQAVTLERGGLLELSLKLTEH